MSFFFFKLSKASCIFKLKKCLSSAADLPGKQEKCESPCCYQSSVQRSRNAWAKSEQLFKSLAKHTSRPSYILPHVHLHEQVKSVSLVM